MKTGASFNLLQSWQVCMDLLSLFVQLKMKTQPKTLGLSVLPWKQHNHHRLQSFCSPFLESRTCLPAFSNFQADLFSDLIWVLSSLSGHWFRPPLKCKAGYSCVSAAFHVQPWGAEDGILNSLLYYGQFCQSWASFSVLRFQHPHIGLALINKRDLYHTSWLLLISVDCIK